ncbi:sugar ABC transporter permease, partial [Streptomyces griseorubiginosus]
MTTDTTSPQSPEAAVVPPSGPAPSQRVPQGHKRLLTRRDR